MSLRLRVIGVWHARLSAWSWLFERKQACVFGNLNWRIFNAKSACANLRALGLSRAGALEARPSRVTRPDLRLYGSREVEPVNRRPGAQAARFP